MFLKTAPANWERVRAKKSHTLYDVQDAHGASYGAVTHKIRAHSDFYEWFVVCQRSLPGKYCALLIAPSRATVSMIQLSANVHRREARQLNQSETK